MSRKNDLRKRMRQVAQYGSILVLAGLASGCSGEVARFGDTIFTGSTGNQKSILPQKSSPTYDEVVTGSIDKSKPKSTAKSSEPVWNNPDNRVTSAPIRPASPAARKGGWSAAGGSQVTVQKGETIATVSRRYGVPPHAIRSANNLSVGDSLSAGQKIIIPTYVQGRRTASTTPVRNVSSSNSSVPPIKPVATEKSTTKPMAGGGHYVVRSGETLGGIAAKYGMSSRELMAANNIESADRIRVGQKLRIPTASMTVANRPTTPKVDYTVTGAIPKTKPDSGDKPTRKAPKPRSDDPYVKRTRAITKINAEDGNTTKSNRTNDVVAKLPSKPTGAKSGMFRWPVRGRVIQQFGSQANGQHNDGINLEVPEGTSVKAAESGKVIYSGNELKGYGNLVLIRHRNGWVTAYAHNSDLMVSRGDDVRRGQIIARAGATGAVNRPQLHFELRRGSQPIDPIPYMSGT